MSQSSPLPTSQNRVELHALTGLRFLAAMQVVLFHTHPLVGPSLPSWLSIPASGGHHAVPLFFVLSGFILHHTYFRTDWKRPGERHNYFVNRIARIYPVYLLSFLTDVPRAATYFLTVYDALTGLAKIAISGFAFLTLTQTWVPRLASAWNPPGWSVSNEAVFYLLFPWLLPLVARLSPRGTLVGLGLTVAAASLGQILGRLAVDALGAPPQVWSQYVLIFPPLRVFEFAFGVLLGRLYVLVQRRPAPAPWVGAAFTLFSAAVILTLAHPHMLPFIQRHHGLLLPFFGILIVALTLDANPFTKLLSLPPVRFLGGASYAIYLLHTPLYWVLDQLLARAKTPASPTVFTVYLTLLIVICSLVFQFFEEPARRYIRTRFSRRLAPPSPELPIPPPDTSISPPK